MLNFSEMFLATQIYKSSISIHCHVSGSLFRVDLKDIQVIEVPLNRSHYCIIIYYSHFDIMPRSSHLNGAAWECLRHRGFQYRKSSLGSKRQSLCLQLGQGISLLDFNNVQEDGVRTFKR